MGEILIAGMAAMLITIFLGPKFIDYLRLKEFGQQIREEGPAGHHGKAGTPTMGGLAIFIAIAVPFLILSDYHWGSLAVLGTAVAMAALGFADDIIKLRRRRSLGVSGKTKLFVQALAAIGLWIVVNLPGVPFPKFDPTYVVLAMFASVEAIFLSTFVLISQNRMAALADKRADLDLQVSLLAEHEITRTITLLRDIADQMHIESSQNPELTELSRDVAPEKVLDKMEQFTHEVGRRSPNNRPR